MDLDEIRTFVTIARERSFSGAAGTLGRSQPAISRRIELLESELGAKLFERLRAGAVLTDAGSALLPYAEAMLANAKDGAASVRDLQAGDTGNYFICPRGHARQCQADGRASHLHPPLSQGAPRPADRHKPGGRRVGATGRCHYGPALPR